MGGIREPSQEFGHSSGGEVGIQERRDYCRVAVNWHLRSPPPPLFPWLVGWFSPEETYWNFIALVTTLFTEGIHGFVEERILFPPFPVLSMNLKQK